MWLATQHGFYSIVRKAPDTYHVRARVRRDLKNLLRVSGLDCLIHEWDEADYRYRIIIDLEDFLEIVVVLAAGLDYDNFKQRVEAGGDQRDKIGAYYRIWSLMAELQSSGEEVG